MPKTHPSELLLREAAESVANEDQRQVLAHIAVCERCRETFAGLLKTRPNRLAGRLAHILRPLSGGAGSYDGAFAATARTFLRRQQAFELERIEAVGLLAELLEQPPLRREVLLANCRRFQTWGLLELLLERSREETRRDTEEGEALAILSLLLADHLDVECYTEELIEDFKARAWGFAANARRIRPDLRGAEEAFERSFVHLRHGTQDSMERAIFLDLKASLRRDQRRFNEAVSFLRRAVAVFLEAGDWHRAGRSLINLATVHEHAGTPEEAIPILYRALDLIDPGQEPRLLLCARHNLITNLAESGRSMDAQALYAKTRALYLQFPDPWAQNRRRWVEGKIAREQRRVAEAAVAFQAARDGFLAEGAAYDTALVSLELAALHAEQGRAAELKRLVREMMPVFSSQRIHREALAALAFFKQAVELERASLELVSHVAAYLKRAEHDPALRFEAPA